MEIPQILLADYANISQEGKLNVLGIFDRLISNSFPILIPQFVIIFYYKLDFNETSTKRKFHMCFIDDDGTEIFGVKGVAVFPIKQNPLLESVGHRIINVSGLTFPHAGDYALHIKIDGALKAETHLNVVDSSNK